MRKTLIILFAVVSMGSMLFGRSGMQSPGPSNTTQGDKKIINLTADVVYPIQTGDSSAVCFVGSFAAQHNGAIITSDSAVRYSDKHIEFFGNVLINKNTTYVYGDRADYNGEINQARVYSDLIKVVDGQATLYTHEFSFDTKLNIGRFGSGGMLINRDNLLESEYGYYYADKKELICVSQVEMRNDEYEMTGDSVVYNMASDHAYYFQNTNIWSKEGDYLYADRGEYEKKDTLYSVTSNGYILTPKQELWSDSLRYYRPQGHVMLWRDIQVDDTEHKTLAFGDYGEYWKVPGNAILTRRPSIINYDPKEPDSLYMRADSILLFTIDPQIEKAAKALRKAQIQRDSMAAITTHTTTTPVYDSTARPTLRDSMPQATATAPIGIDTLSKADSLPRKAALAADSLGGEKPAKLTPAQRKEQLQKAAEKLKAERKIAAATAKKAKLDSISERRLAKTRAKLMAQKEREELRLKASKLRAESKLRARELRAARKGKVLSVDSTAVNKIDSLLSNNALVQDSLQRLLVDSLTADSTLQIRPDSLDSLDSLSLDSIYRMVKGYRNVRVYRKDVQTVCDSLVAISSDSTIHLYIQPVLWSDNNQITSEVMDIYTANQQLLRAEFIGQPMMVSELDTTHYNQVAGKTMTAYFRQNQIYRNDVNGNAQTIYYMQDGRPPEVVTMAVIESGSITFYIENKQIDGITYRTNPDYKFYPLDKIPPDQELYLKDFKWEGTRRPARSDVFDRQIRPSQRMERLALPHPLFPIAAQINEHKKQLITTRRWADRNEKVSPEAEAWMRDLGFVVGEPRAEGATQK